MADSLADLRRAFWLANTTDTDASWSSADLERKYLTEQLGLPLDAPQSNADLEMTFYSDHVSP